MLPDRPRIELYHKHILQDIKHLDDRASNYLSHRLNYLEQKCEPVQQRIDQLKTQAEHYKQIQANNDNETENRPDIKKLRTDISKFKQTQQFYQKQLDDLEKAVFEVEAHNDQLRERIRQLKKQFFVGKRSGIPKNTQQSGSNDSLNDYKNTSLAAYSRSVQLPLVFTSAHKNKQNQKQASNYCSSRVNKSHMHTESSPTHHNSMSMHFNEANVSVLSQKQERLIQNLKTPKQTRMIHNPSISEIGHSKGEKGNQVQKIKEENSEEDAGLRKEEARLRSMVQNFNKTDCLFLQCLELKKNMVQKMISQLQSKLVKKKGLFVKICDCITSGEEQEIEQEEFGQLDGDEIVTLLVSFPTIYKRFNKYLTKKREKMTLCSNILKDKYK